MSEKKIVIKEDGPYFVSGNIPLSTEIAISLKGEDPCCYEKGKKYDSKDSYALCRCGKSKNKPYCDGTHVSIEFEGNETASKEVYKAKAHTIKGPGMVLMDYPSLCSGARFCHNDGGTWNNLMKTDKAKYKKIVALHCANCPSGRLVCFDKGKEVEAKFSQEIGLIEDMGAEVSGPIWVKGKIKIYSSDGQMYETRNRVTLCRCGKSSNKPFCDGTHIAVKFRSSDYEDSVKHKCKECKCKK